MGPWMLGILVTYSSLTPVMANEKCVYGQVSDPSIPTNYRVVSVDGHFVVARTLYLLYVLPVMGSWAQGILDSYSSYIPTIANQTCVYDQIWSDPIPVNCPVVKVGGHFRVARTLFYPVPQVMGSWVQGILGKYSSYTPIIANQKCLYLLGRHYSHKLPRR